MKTQGLIVVLIIKVLSCVALNFYSHTVQDIRSNEVDLKDYSGKVSLVVNVASECGFTERHYKGLVRLQQILGSDGHFNVLAFPCNQFGNQEPKPNSDILKWAEDNYNVNFPMFSKINVLEKDVSPAWNFIIENSSAPNWNFWKYLVGPEGNVIKSWGPWSDVEEIFDEVKNAVDAISQINGPKRPKVHSKVATDPRQESGDRIVGPPPPRKPASVSSGDQDGLPGMEFSAPQHDDL